MCRKVPHPPQLKKADAVPLLRVDLLPRKQLSKRGKQSIATYAFRADNIMKLPLSTDKKTHLLYGSAVATLTWRLITRRMPKGVHKKVQTKAMHAVCSYSGKRCWTSGSPHLLEMIVVGLNANVLYAILRRLWYVMDTRLGRKGPDGVDPGLRRWHPRGFTYTGAHSALIHEMSLMVGC